MTNKNSIAIATHLCPICGDEHEHNTEILIHKGLGNIDPNKRCTGYGLCEEHDKLHKDGFVAMVAIDPDKSTLGANGNYVFEEAYRTGDMVHIRVEVFNELFNTEWDMEKAFTYTEQAVLDHLRKMSEGVE